MRIVVLVKEVPDTYGQRKLSLETGLADRAASDAVLDEIGERALEVALSRMDQAGDIEVTILSMAPASATATIRKGLAMGATKAVHVVDDALVGADLSLTAEALAAALRRMGFDLVVAGNQSTDGSGGVLPAMIAELLGVPSATYLNSVDITGPRVVGERATDAGTVAVTVDLPAIISVTERLPDGRFPNFKGIMAAKKKPIETVSLSELGVAADDPAGARSIVIGISEKPPRSAGIKIVDEGDAGKQLAKYLLENKLA